MRKKLFPFITILTLALFLGACNSEDVMPEIGSETNPELTERTISFTASMPGEDDPATRVSATEEDDRGITLTWDANDKLDLLFVQGENKINVPTQVTTIDNAGKNATFTVPIPEGITDGTPYNLYGVYGGGAVSTTNPALIGLPAIEEEALNEENVGKKVMLRFAKENLNLTDAVGAVNFEHVGFLFTAKIKTISDTAPDITSVQLVGADATNETWAYNASENHFNMETGGFTAVGTGSNTVSFQNSEKDVNNNILTVRNWQPAIGTAWPALKLSVNGTESADAKPARTPEVGKAYYLYATWNGTDLVFADKDFTVPQTGTKISIADLRAKYVADGTYAEDHFIEGEVVLNAKNGNVNALAAYVADETAGISFFFTYGDNVVTDAPLGAKVKINLQGATWDSYYGLIQLKSLSTGTAVEILEPTATTPLEPRVVTIQELLDGNYQSELVQVNNVQFKKVPATYGSNPDLIDNNAIEINVRSSSDATFKDENVPEGNGPFIGVVGMFKNAQLHVRETADLAGMTGPRYVPPFINVNPFSLTFEKEAGSETIAVTSNVAWTATSDATWATISPASGTNDGTILVSAEANSGADARNATITITPEASSGLPAIEYSVTQAGATVVFATDLFFSEYIEGSSNNKYLEIYNGTGVDVDLSEYEVKQYNNGKTEASAAYTIGLTGILEHGKVYVIANANADIYTGTPDLSTTSSTMTFNGDDAIALLKDGAYIDIIGEIGVDPGTKWSAGGDLETVDKTLIRKSSVKGGVTVNPVGKGFETLATEWIGYPKDTATYLGSHTTNY